LVGIISVGIPLYAKNKKSKSISFGRSLRNSSLGKNYRKSRVQGAKFHRLSHLHRAFLLRPFPDPRKHIFST
jgi:hypothetical protein